MAEGKKRHSGQFKEGNPGRPEGATNKITRTVKEAFIHAFNELQQDPKVNLVSWGKTNPTKFYEFVRAVMPTEVSANLTGKIITVTAPNMKKFSSQSPDLQNNTDQSKEA